MPIDLCVFDCKYFIDGEIGPDVCRLAKRIIYADEENRLPNTLIPTWCPEPNQIKIIGKCDDCNRNCKVKGYCWDLKRIVDLNSIPAECPLEDGE